MGFALIIFVKTQLAMFAQLTATAFQALARQQLGFVSYNMVLHVQLQISVYLVFVAALFLVSVYKLMVKPVL